MKKRFTITAVAFVFSILFSFAQNEPFWFGVDMGWLTEYESKGWQCRDRNGNPCEAMELMGQYGVNAERIRVWVDPSKHGGWCGKEDVLVKCKRAKALGQEIMIDFHYSDWWADPAKQNIPAAWQGHSYEQMKKDLANHTIDVLKLLKKNGITPRWVQVGNETSNGFLWSVKTDPKTGWEIKDENGTTQITESMGHAKRNPEQYAGFFKAGYDAVKKVFPKAIVIVHLDNGFDNKLYNWNLDILRSNGAKFDMIGMSLYPYWSMRAKKEPSAQKTIDDCIKNINLLTEKYGCDVMITETGFEVDEKNPEKMHEGRNQLRQLISRCYSETNNRCKGVFYWEPECRPGQYKLGAFTSDGSPTVIMDAYLEQSMIINTPWKLVWHDEFDGSGELNTEVWQAERGFVRNEEYQWYQQKNAYRQGGVLVLEGRLDSIPNPRYREGSNRWQENRPYAKYSSASVNTRRSYSFLYGRMEVRARIPAVMGSWPAIWTLGTNREWPSNGEIDIMEYYHIKGVPHILANAAWGNDKHYSAVWDSKTTPYDHFLAQDPYWGEKFHIWTMDWTPEYIRIYLDGELLNDVSLSKTINGTVGDHANPFHEPQYILLDLAIGGINGGEPVPDAFPMRYEIDYVRVYQK